MILSDRQILNCIDNGSIKIEPFRRECLGSNSYDVHLGPYIGIYAKNQEPSRASGLIGVELPRELNAKQAHHLALCEIPEEGIVLLPGTLYLAATEEYTETHHYVPWLDGKSSVGRLGIRIHATAGRGDAGFMNHWTLEIDCVQRVRIYKGMPIGQLTYFSTGPIDVPHNEKETSVYRGTQVGPVPIPSMMYKNFDKRTGAWK